MDFRNLLCRIEPPLALVTLNRAQRRNALSLELMVELTASLKDVSADDRVSVVILGAAGTAFCSGHDLNELVNQSVRQYRSIYDACVELMNTVQAIPQPVIASVQGVATAAGCQLVAACDLAVAAEEAKFGTPGVRIGLFCTTPMVALTRAVGRKRALEMLLTGRMIDARTAAEWGLVNRVVPASELEAATHAFAAEIAEASRFTVGLGKQAFYAQIDLDQAKAYAYAKEVMTMNTLAADAHEGITAFLEKRVPCWSNR